MEHVRLQGPGDARALARAVIDTFLTEGVPCLSDNIHDDKAFRLVGETTHSTGEDHLVMFALEQYDTYNLAVMLQEQAGVVTGELFTTGRQEPTATDTGDQRRRVMQAARKILGEAGLTVVPTPEEGEG